MFCECEDPDIEKYADDTTPYACVSDINTVISGLHITASKLFTWFNSNHMIVNPEKSHLLLCTKTLKNVYFGEALVESSSAKKLEFRLILTLLLTKIFLLYLNKCTQPPC